MKYIFIYFWKLLLGLFWLLAQAALIIWHGNAMYCAPAKEFYKRVISDLEEITSNLLLVTIILLVGTLIFAILGFGLPYLKPVSDIFRCAFFIFLFCFVVSLICSGFRMVD